MVTAWLQRGCSVVAAWLQYGFNMVSTWLALVGKLTASSESVAPTVPAMGRKSSHSNIITEKVHSDLLSDAL